MVMDFIAAQESARARTGRLVLFFALAVVMTVAITYFVVTAALVLSGNPDDPPLSWWQPLVLLYCGGGIIAVIAIGSLVKTSQLSAGGSAVAQSLGGRLVHPDSRDASERRLLNVVEEMAIASGCPVPPVFLIDDESINAFAAGFTHDSAVIGVTRGCVAQLSRDELQGVIAHEFSHIVHGDIRLNIRLTGVIFGIMAIGFIGYVLFRFVAPSLLYSRDKNSAPIALGVVGLGLLLVVVGAIGTFFARLIQAAVSRQREFLADASAVNYTRNPSGIGGALRRIGGLETNRMKQASASEFQHFFFTPALHTLLATHPPTAERVSRIENRPVAEVSSDPAVAVAGVHAAAAGFAAGAVRESISHLGDAGPEHLAYARAVLSRIPDGILHAVRDPIGAQAVCLLLLVDSDARVAAKQAKVLEEALLHEVVVELMRLKRTVLPAVAGSPELRMVLADMAMPALARLSKGAAGQFLAAVSGMVHADGQVDRFEWMLGRVLKRHLSVLGGGDGKRPAATKALASLHDSARTVLAMLAWSGAKTEDEATLSFRASVGAAGIGDVQLPSHEACSIASLGKALDRLEALRYRDRAVLLDAAVHGVCSDGMATLGEVELLRALAAALDCPMPPVLPGPTSKN